MKRRHAVELWTPRASARSDLTLETVLTHPDYFGLVTASYLQRAICRVLDGIPLGDLEKDEEVRAAFGDVEQLPDARPAELVLLAGIRCGKSLISAACAVRAALTCDVSRLGAGDIPRISVLSYSVDTARATWQHVRGHVEASAALRGLLVSEPTADMIVLRHPSGRPVEIKVVAGSRAAGSLVARWSAGVIFDEAPRMVGAEDGVVNLDDARQASIGRLLPGAQILMIGSPWAPFGPVFGLVEQHEGKPSKALVVVRAPAYAMNPQHWTRERCDELRETNPDAYWVDVECKFIDPKGGMFTLEEIRRATRSQPERLPFNPRIHYAAAMDPATRGNAWALAVTANLGKILGSGGDRYAVVLAHQWQGSATEPLKSRQVFTEMRELLAPYGLKTITTDQWCLDNLREMAHECGLGLIEYKLTGQKEFELFKKAKDLMADGSLELAPVKKLQSDLCSIRKVATQRSVRVEYPIGPDGRHADFAPALAKALSRSLLSPAPEELSADEALKAEQARWRKQAQLEVLQRQRQRMRGLA